MPFPDASAVASRLLLGLTLVLGPGTTACGGEDDDGLHCVVGSPQYQTDLYFGRSRPGNEPVSEAEFQAFVDTAVTPRFREGLTVYDANGQYQLESGEVVQERTKVMVLLHDGSAARSADVDTIREEYKSQFNQESVLRIDSQPCVAF
ncbi:DUF3574 domain-containing protein [Corallococcus aberystwythensis]|uniref:DUF3574 domain-containing protein n=1 Tax=Corallococcus aberystwythensis TaxID=2316722 RepID=A0A3A8PQB2_9BACT|nr:DUF3574 domain-containing protein [Corallococcus aberystwythensis]RKH58637.1 DUF3574 domain-containing protein [Corallococcus aberystwythensis]